MSQIFVNISDFNQKDVKRFNDKVLFSNDCWEWSGYKIKGGYGQFSYKGKLVLAHRFSYNLNIGHIPDYLVLDHLCRNTSCVNPSHLEAVTQKENIKRGETGYHNNHSNGNKLKTHCKQGHEYNESNTYYRPKGGRNCRMCNKTDSNRRYHNE